MNILFLYFALVLLPTREQADVIYASQVHGWQPRQGDLKVCIELGISPKKG